ncbi:MAG: hypothetical protein WKG06_18540 [Segetibacter sp.]
MKRICLLIVITLTFFDSSFAAIDTVSIYSASMFKNVKCVVITPSDYTKSKLIAIRLFTCFMVTAVIIVTG